MINSYELVSLVSRGKAYQRGARLRDISMLIICFITVIGGALGQLANPAGMMSASPYRTSVVVSRLTENGWQQLALPADCECQYATAIASEEGMIWLNAVPDGVYRFREGVWEHYLAELPEVSDDYSIAILAANGDEVWGGSTGNVMFFDGEDWTTYEDVLPSYAAPSSIVITDDQVVVAGYNAVAVRAPDGTWSRTYYDNLLPDYSEDEYFYDAELYPTLQVAPDGVVWLSYGGIFRYEDGTWKLVRALAGEEFYYSQLVGVDGRGAWIAGEGQIEHIDAEGEVIEQFDFSEIGIGEEEHFYQGAVRDGVVAASTYQDLYIYADGIWTQPPALFEGLGGYGYVMALGFDADNSLYAIRLDSPAGFANASQLLAAPLLALFFTFGTALGTLGIILLPLGDLLLRYIPEILSGRHRWQDTQQVLAVIGIEPGQKPRNPYSWWRIVLGGIMTLLVTGGAILLATTSLSLYAGDGDSGLFDQLAAQTAFVSPGLVAVGVYLLLRLISRQRYWGDRTFQQIYRWVLNGQYEDALKSLVVPGKRGEPVVSNPALYVLTLLNAKQADEAETFIQPYLQNSHRYNPAFVATILSYLGAAARQRDNFDDAIRYQRAALAVMPEQESYYAFLADTLIRVKGDAKLALELTTAAQPFADYPRIPWNFYSRLLRGAYADFEATHALALAHNGRHDEAKQTAESALLHVPQEFPLMRADVEVFYGQVLLETGDQVAARGHFESAANLDPNGAEGQVARQFLHSIDDTPPTP